MKRTMIMLAVIILSISTYSQQFVCKQDTIHLYQTNYRGILSWQKSENGVDWSQLPGSQSDTLMVVGTNSIYYRTEVIEGLCKPYYSDIIHLIINELPLVTLETRDSVCLNDTDLILDGGVPAGGSYWGDGVVDGKFSPDQAGAGKHKIYYRYSDSQTGCSNTTDTDITVLGLPDQAVAGNDLSLIFADSVLLDANIPENGIGSWTLINGSYGHFSDVHSAKAWFIRDSANLEFTLRWSVTGKCHNSSDDVEIAFFQLSKNPCPNAPTVTDADGNVYPTVQIGNQCWMAKNLDVGRYVPSTYSNTGHSDLSNNGIYEKYCYENKIENCRLYGGLYDWNEAMDYTNVENAQGICPQGWHIPGDIDWSALNLYFYLGNCGKLIKVGGSSGFEAYCAGDRNILGQFSSFDAGGFWWQSTSLTENGLDDGLLSQVAACKSNLERTHYPKQTGLSVRCIKNTN